MSTLSITCQHPGEAIQQILQQVLPHDNMRKLSGSCVDINECEQSSAAAMTL